MRPQSTRALANGTIPQRLDDLPGDEELVDFKSKAVQGEDDVIFVHCGTAGGFGDPIEREPERVANDVRAGTVSAAVAIGVYGTVLDAHGAPDVSATSGRREEIRQERKARSQLGTGGDGPSATCPSPASGVARRISESLIADRGRVVCARCAHDICDAGDNYKLWVLQDRSSVAEVPGVIGADAAYEMTDVLELRRYYCPECCVQLSVEVSEPAEPPLWDVQLVTAGSGE